MHKTLCLALLLAATAHALAADDATSKQTADFRQWQKRVNAEQAAADSALTDLQQRAAAGDATAQFELGALYYLGQGVPQDYAQARTWYEKAAVQGHAKAQFNLGALYENGQGITRDYDKARAWYEKVAAQTDDQEAQQAAQQVLQDLDKTGNNKP